MNKGRLPLSLSTVMASIISALQLQGRARTHLLAAHGQGQGKRATCSTCNSHTVHNIPVPLHSNYNNNKNKNKKKPADDARSGFVFNSLTLCHHRTPRRG